MKRIAIDAPVTPSHKATITAGSIPARLVKMPQVDEDSFVLNPTLKGFLQAKPDHAEPYFPIRPFGRRMVKRDSGSAHAEGAYHAEGTPAKRTPKATVRTSRG